MWSLQICTTCTTEITQFGAELPKRQHVRGLDVLVSNIRCVKLIQCYADLVQRPEPPCKVKASHSVHQLTRITCCLFEHEIDSPAFWVIFLARKPLSRAVIDR
jgi:hypothetical protein